ncbi:MAG: DUF1109 domain-containing protein [Acidobacteriota bacterium]|nr:DUF1109 domain-containing protein [Acidobacteriota bacterium]
MNCQNIDNFLSEGSPLDARAQEHVAGCSSCRSLITGFAGFDGQPTLEEIAAIKKLLSSDLERAKALPSDRKLVTLLLLFFVSFAVLAAWPFHYFGLHALTANQMAVYFGVIAACAFLCAVAIVQEMIPGSRRRIRPALAIALGTSGLVAVTVMLFPNLDSSHFVRYGMGCFRVGSLCGVVAGLLLWLTLRKGFFTSPVSGAVTVAFFASLAGVAVLAMHCSLLTVPHILVWHFGVLAVGAAAGTGLGWLFENLNAKRFSANRNFAGKIPE